MNQKIEVYTDGGCSGNPGPGGWAWVMLDGKSRQVLAEGSGHESLTTNNRMELTAVIEALSILEGRHTRISDRAESRRDKGPRLEESRLDISQSGIKGPFKQIVVHTDSEYVRNGITQWIFSWIRNGWKTAAKKPVKNREYWIALKSLVDRLPIEWKWVPGHAGVEFNERCDALVQQEIELCRQQQSGREL